MNRVHRPLLSLLVAFFMLANATPGARAGLAAAPAAAQADSSFEPTAAQPETDCTQAQTQSAMNACVYDDFLAATVGYAERYRTLSKRLPATQRDRLRRMQTAWINFRTAACRFESAPTAGGSIYDFVYWRCAACMTRERSADLDRLATCTEGDITCTPSPPCAYFSDRGRPFQSDRGRCFSVIVDGMGRRTSLWLNVSQSSTISLKRPAAAPASRPVLGLD